MGVPRNWKPRRGPLSRPRPSRPAFDRNTTISTTPDGTVRVIFRPTPRQQQVWNEPDELAVTVATIGVEVDGPPDLRWVSFPAPQHPNFANDEDQSAFGGLRIDEDYQWAAQYLQLVANRQPILDTDEPGILGGIRTDEDHPWVAQYNPILANKQPLTDTDEPGLLGGFRLGEETGSTDQIYRPISNRQLFLDTEELAQLISNIGVEENEYRPTQYVPLLPNRQPITDTEELSTSSATQSATGAPRVVVRATPRQQQIWNVPDELGFAAASPALDEEIDALRLIGQPVLPRPRFCIGHEELAPRGIDEDEWTQPRTVELVRNRQPLLDTEERGFVIGAFGLDEDGWTQPTPGSAASMRWVGTEDESSAPLGGFRLDEETGSTDQCYRTVSNRWAYTDTDEWVVPPPVTFVRIVQVSGSIPTAAAVSGSLPGAARVSGIYPTARDVTGVL